MDGTPCANGCETPIGATVPTAYTLHINGDRSSGLRFCSARCLVEWASREAVRVHAESHPEAAAELTAEVARPSGSPRTRLPKTILKDARERERQAALVTLEREIREKFAGHVEKGEDIIDHMATVHRWGNKTTRKRLQLLVNEGRLTMKRSEVDHWTGIYDIPAPEATG